MKKRTLTISILTLFVCSELFSVFATAVGQSTLSSKTKTLTAENYRTDIELFIPVRTMMDLRVRRRVVKGNPTPQFLYQHIQIEKVFPYFASAPRDATRLFIPIELAEITEEKPHVADDSSAQYYLTYQRTADDQYVVQEARDFIGNVIKLDELLELAQIWTDVRTRSFSETRDYIEYTPTRREWSRIREANGLSINEWVTKANDKDTSGIRYRLKIPVGYKELNYAFVGEVEVWHNDKWTPYRSYLKEREELEERFDLRLKEELDLEDYFFNHMVPADLDVREYLFLPGMLPYDMEEWWELAPNQTIHSLLEHLKRNKGNALGIQRIEQHDGTDFFGFINGDGKTMSLKPGTPIAAIADGTVVNIYDDEVINSAIVQRLPIEESGFVAYALYVHTAPNIKEGADVKAGSVIGTISEPKAGMNNWTGSPMHLHFEIRWLPKDYNGPFTRSVFNLNYGPSYISDPFQFLILEGTPTPGVKTLKAKKPIWKDREFTLNELNAISNLAEKLSKSFRSKQGKSPAKKVAKWIRNYSRTPHVVTAAIEKVLNGPNVTEKKRQILEPYLLELKQSSNQRQQTTPAFLISS